MTISYTIADINKFSTIFILWSNEGKYLHHDGCFVSPIVGSPASNYNLFFTNDNSKKWVWTEENKGYWSYKFRTKWFSNYYSRLNLPKKFILENDFS